MGYVIPRPSRKNDQDVNSQHDLLAYDSMRSPTQPMPMPYDRSRREAQVQTGNDPYGDASCRGP